MINSKALLLNLFVELKRQNSKCRTNIRKTRLAWSWHGKNAMRIDPINKISELRHRFFVNVASAPLRAVCLPLEACFNSTPVNATRRLNHTKRWKFSISADLTFQVHGKSQCQMRFAMVSDTEIEHNSPCLHFLLLAGFIVLLREKSELLNVKACFKLNF